jgi:hypothetical protein
MNITLAPGIRLDAAFRDACALYFPQWNRGFAWSIGAYPPGQVVPGQEGADAIGHCVREAREIRVEEPYAWFGGTSLRRLIIHEICHAVRAGYHGAAWQTRFREASDRAESLGDVLLAEGIRRELTNQHPAGGGGYWLTKDQVHFEIRELVHSRPRASYYDVTSLIGMYHGGDLDELMDDAHCIPAFREAQRERCAPWH